MKKNIILILLSFFLSSCALATLSRLGEIIPGKMYSVDSDKVLDFGVELILASSSSGTLTARDNERGINYSGFYSNLYPQKTSEGYNLVGTLFVEDKEYSIYLIVTPSYSIPSGVGVAKENGKIKYRVSFPVYD